MLLEACSVESVDVVLLTFNSDRKLRECLESVYQNVSVNRLIVVDGGSQDRTLDILNEFNSNHGNVEIIADKGNRATARQKGIQSVQTEWFLFVDSDVILCKDWHRRAFRQVDQNVGAVWGIEVWSTIQSQKTLKLFLWLTRKIFDLRGGTHDTLIRTDAVRGIKIPERLHVFEDAYIKNWVKKRYHVVACYDPFCIHYRPKDVWTFRGSLNLIVESLRFGNPLVVGRLVFAYGFYAAYSLSQMFTGKSKGLSL
jgi:glycosyltransferase involved in cell wall biosynthesis